MARASVVIPTYNRAHVLPETLESVLGQTYQDFDVWIVDDGSTDGTREALEAYLGDRVHYVRQENRGPSAARNTGIRVSGGELVSFLDSDDVWLPEKLAREVGFLDRHRDVGVVCSDVLKFGQEASGPFAHTCPVFRSLIHKYRIGEECVIPAQEMYDCLLEEMPIRPSAFTVRRQALKDCLFDEEMRRSSDWPFFLELARKEACGFIDVPLVRLRIWEEGLHIVDRSVGYALSIQVLQQQASLHELTPRQKAAIRRGIGERYRSWGRHLYREGEHRKAAMAFLRGFLLLRRPVILGQAVASLFPDKVYEAIRAARSRFKHALGNAGQRERPGEGH